MLRPKQKNVPFIPVSLIDMGADFLLVALSTEIDASLVAAFEEYVGCTAAERAALPILPKVLRSKAAEGNGDGNGNGNRLGEGGAEENTDSILEGDAEEKEQLAIVAEKYGDDEPFSVQLRRHMAEKLLEVEADHWIIHIALSGVSDRNRALGTLKLVDLILSAVPDLHKLESVVAFWSGRVKHEGDGTGGGG